MHSTNVCFIELILKWRRRHRHHHHHHRRVRRIQTRMKAKLYTVKFVVKISRRK